MSTLGATFFGLVPVVTVLLCLAVLVVPFGNYMAWVFQSPKHWKVEKAFYRVMGVDESTSQRWNKYALSVFTFSLLSVLAVYLLQRTQQWLPLSFGMGPVKADQAWNTAVSFTTNTNWQSYSGEQAMTPLTQMMGLGVQNYLSAAVGMCVAIALVRGLAAKDADGRIGNFWVDMVRCVLRILLPAGAVAALLLMTQGVIQNFNAPAVVDTIAGGQQTIQGGAVATQEAIKELGTNGGGFFNANSSHPFENPNQITNMLEIFLILLIPVSLTRTFGTMVGDTRQGWAILAAMGTLYAISLAVVTTSELGMLGHKDGWASALAGGAMEGRESRFGVIPSAFFAVSTTMTSTGAVDSFHSTYTPLGGGMIMLNMLLGEISPGGVGAGLYGMLIVAVLAVFIAGLMVGRTPEYLGKRIGVSEMKAVSLYILTMPILVLTGVGVSVMLPKTMDSLSEGNVLAHGFSDVVYAFTSGANNNGSAFAGFGADTPWFNITIALAMLFGRFIPIIMILVLAGLLASQKPVPVTAGTLPTHRPQFVGLIVGVAIIVSALTFLPTLVLGPLTEALA
ncbi:Potassium-transporting ATPase A chain [Corynebacterium ciconiae DSM 44920]|uniref:potassium-transporting ATPase subunit KdpA n=1 Tax=Corynebacterium ciconiae TaxID=227319 RepID=UPI000476901C|nr:potassium-transporting ATPase subunit KdpA [Corynebacterium ciconiae]WKD60098.1 Potassium-transporting ATPase A chain [Corynebacterium ciconiae DSM 44920]